jgi:hypothetical protein
MREFAKILNTTNGNQVLVVRAYSEGKPVLEIYACFDEEIMQSTWVCESETRRDQMFEGMTTEDANAYSDMLYAAYLENGPELGGRPEGE